MTTDKRIPIEPRQEWDEYRTSFGGQIDPAFEEFLNEKRTYRLNAWFGQKSLYENR